MKRIYLIITLIISSLLFAGDIPLNFTIVPGINFFRGKHTTYLSTGTISSEVFRLEGIQVGPLFAIASNNMDGLQISGIFNISKRHSQGMQSGGVFNISGRMDGFQAGGIFNIADNIDGFQTGGIFNVADDVDGFQVGGVINIAEDLDGFQTAGVINIADDVNGFQSSGVINIADNVQGSQIGIINVAGSGSNLQVGVINIVTKNSRHTQPIGLINIYKGGTFDITSWVDDKSYIYQSLDMGSRNLYTQFYTGAVVEKFQQIEDRVFGTAIGFKLNPKALALDITLGVKNIFNQNFYKNWTPEAKASLGIKIGSFSIFGGVDGTFQFDGFNNESEFFTNSIGFALNEYADFHYNYFAGVKLHL